MSRQDVLNKAQSQDGTAESPPNSNKSIYGLGGAVFSKDCILKFRKTI